MNTALFFDIAVLVTLVTLVAIVLQHQWRMQRTSPPGDYPRPHKLHVLNQRCVDCAHWDRAEGQLVMSKFPAFKGAAEVITPAEMAYGYELNEKDERVGLKGPKEAATFAWEDFGACAKHAELRHKGDKCDEFTAREEA